MAEQGDRSAEATRGEDLDRSTETQEDEQMTDAQQDESSGVAGASTTALSNPETETPTVAAESAASEEGGNGSDDQARSTSGQVAASIQGGLRSTSSKIASLRAAFEQGGKAEGGTDSMKRKQTGGERTTDASGERLQEYEAEVTRLREELEKEKEMRIAYEEKVTTLEEDVEELATQLEERDDLWREEFERRSTKMKSEAESRLNVIQNEARSQKLEAENLQKQLSDLKRSVSMSTRPTTQVSDSTFKQEMGVLQHEVQNWVVNTFRRVKVDTSPSRLCEKLESVTTSRQLAFLRPIYQSFDSPGKLPIYQATLACHMMDIFDEPYLVGLPGDQEWCTSVRLAADSLSNILEPKRYNLWRAVTFDGLRQSESMNDAVENASEKIAEMICTTLQAMTQIEDSEIKQSSLTPIVKKAISLAHLIRVQRARYVFVLPPPSQAFDPDTMDDISDDSDADTERTVRCATFPSIIKLGDEEGDHLELRNPIVKAQVLCNEPSP